ncbi:hypothetical protein BDV26DRAFT_262137 [Aspergillus bertholletiae]|uniref:Uncharacterized protein n=1 Tax=Aspergillus bertholletiae TaxID=1226010 RepID=A0A5N7B8S5_9EURO|nr:hypothetical protein BDV26DRAFT_262137 [Aspergillus bertholletiae]
MPQYLFSKGGSTVQLIKYYGLGEDIAVAKHVAADPEISLLLSSTFVELRQGVSTD